MVEDFFEIGEEDELSLLETLDHVLDKGLVIAGEITISVANIDLIYLGLNVLLGSVDAVHRVLGERQQRLEMLAPRPTHSASTGDEAPEPPDAR